MRVAQLVLASILPRIAALRDSKLIFQSQLSLLQNAAAGAPPPQDSFPHARSTSKFGEILWRANDATRAHDALEALGSNPLAAPAARRRRPRSTTKPRARRETPLSKTRPARADAEPGL